MNDNETNIKVNRWFYQLPFEVRYRFASQWMAEEAAGISIAKLADCLEGDKKNSDTLVKSFRSFDLNTQKLKKVARPERGYTENDVYLICNAINAYRKKSGRDDKVSVSEFYLRAWDELGQEYPQGKQEYVHKYKLKDVQQDELNEAHQEVEHQINNDFNHHHGFAVKGKLLPVNVVNSAVIVACGLLILIIWYVLLLQKDSIADTPNYKQYLPGNVVQLRQVNTLGQLMVLESPEHYLDAERCYPELKSDGEQSAIISYRQLLALPLSGLDSMTSLLPSLSIEFEQTEGVLQSIDIGFVGVHRWHVTKGMINLGIAEVCLASMQQVIDYGNKIDDYGIIKQTYVAQSVEFKMVFAIDAKLQLVEDLTTAIVSHYAGFDVEVIEAQNQQSIMRRVVVNGPVAVGYISQPMSARISR